MKPPALFRSARTFALIATLCSISYSVAAPIAGYKVVAKYPHSTENYTEGFFYLDGLFYEGTGIQGHSAVIATQPETGKVVQQLDLPPQYFGEGIVNWGPNLYEWTWQSHLCFVYDRFSLRPVKQFTYTGEGWGMTRTAKEIITSDGTATLRFRDPATFKETRHILVKDGAKSIDQLNELEYPRLFFSERAFICRSLRAHSMNRVTKSSCMRSSKRSGLLVASMLYANPTSAENVCPRLFAVTALCFPPFGRPGANSACFHLSSVSTSDRNLHENSEMGTP